MGLVVGSRIGSLPFLDLWALAACLMVRFDTFLDLGTLLIFPSILLPLSFDLWVLIIGIPSFLPAHITESSAWPY